VDLEATELAIRAAMHEIGGRLLEKLLHADGGGARGARIDCGQGHQAEFVDYRRKHLTTVLAVVEVTRAYYYCANCRTGLIPKDRELDIVGTAFSLGVRRMIGRVGAKAPFAEGREDLEELAGVWVKTKAVERVAEALGAQIESVGQQERTHAFSGTVVPFKSVPMLYMAMDGTGVPMVPHETAGRRGKDETGQAKTREAKLGCVFTQTGVDDKGRPVRDEASTTSVGAIEAAEPFGRRIYAEAVRRGMTRAAKVIVLGNGARWIWGLAEEHVPNAIHIVDLYHARQHLADLGKLVYGVASAQAKEWVAARSEQLDAGHVEAMITSMRRLRPCDKQVTEAIRKAIEYFQTNRERMRYAHFRDQGLFVGSGVMEAGCKTIIGHRLKQSGMRWTVRGANEIIALRCC